MPSAHESLWSPRAFGPFSPQPLVVAALGVSRVRVRCANAVAEVDHDVRVARPPCEPTSHRHSGSRRVPPWHRGSRRLWRRPRRSDVDRGQLLADRADDDRDLDGRRGARGRGEAEAAKERRHQGGNGQDRAHGSPPGHGERRSRTARSIASAASRTQPAFFGGRRLRPRPAPGGRARSTISCPRSASAMTSAQAA